MYLLVHNRKLNTYYYSPNYGQNESILSYGANNASFPGAILHISSNNHPLFPVMVLDQFLRLWWRF